MVYACVVMRLGSECVNGLLPISTFCLQLITQLRENRFNVACLMRSEMDPPPPPHPPSTHEANALLHPPLELKAPVLNLGNL